MLFEGFGLGLQVAQLALVFAQLPFFLVELMQIEQPLQQLLPLSQLLRGTLRFFGLGLSLLAEAVVVLLLQQSCLQLLLDLFLLHQLLPDLLSQLVLSVPLGPLLQLGLLGLLNLLVLLGLLVLLDLLIQLGLLGLLPPLLLLDLLNLLGLLDQLLPLLPLHQLILLVLPDQLRHLIH